MVALNRAIVIGQVGGPEEGLRALDDIDTAGREQLDGYPFFAAARGEFHRRAGRLAEAAVHLRAALAEARNPSEARQLEQKLVRLENEPGSGRGDS